MTIKKPSLAVMHDFDHILSVDLADASQDLSETVKDVTQVQVTESTAAKIKRLGKMRPESLPSLWREVGLVLSIVMSQILSVH